MFVMSDLMHVRRMQSRLLQNIVLWTHDPAFRHPFQSSMMVRTPSQPSHLSALRIHRQQIFKGEREKNPLQTPRPRKTTIESSFAGEMTVAAARRLEKMIWASESSKNPGAGFHQIWSRRPGVATVGVRFPLQARSLTSARSVRQTWTLS